MGEVYSARDPRLAREVAVKILPESLTVDTDRLRRFKQEARAVAALNHPNILSIHDIGMQGETHYIVTELLVGGTLRQKLSRGPLSWKQAIEYAVQIGHGLSAAHEKGIVHRDLKPENLFITKDGTVKVLDFGLAKKSVVAGNAAETLGASDITSAGMVVGTPGYMAPEQVTGEVVDHRTDIFSFGAVLYEMLSGRRPFLGNSSAEAMAAILKDNPPQLVAGGEPQSPHLQRIVFRCLEKKPGQRFQCISDLAFALENVELGTSLRRADLTTPSTGRRRILSSVLAAIAVLGLVLVVRGFLLRPRNPRYQKVTYRVGFIPTARFAPDGQSVIYGAAWDHPPIKLYSSRLDGTDLRALDMPPSELLAVSHLGELAIALEGRTWAGRKGSRLARVPMGGGAPRELLENVIAADWSPDGTQLAVARIENGKCYLEYPIGKPLYDTIGYISHMRFSPEGDAIAFMAHPILGDDRGNVVLVDLKVGKRRLTSEWAAGEEGLAWSPDGKEIWFTATDGSASRALYAVTRSGRQRTVLRIPGDLHLEDISSDGRVLLTRRELRYEVTVNRIGGQTNYLSWLEIMLAASVSRDGEYAVIGDSSYATGGTNYHAYLAKLDGSPPILLGDGAAGSISPDNKWVTSILPSDTTKVLLLPTAVGETKSITAPNFQYRSAAWASDGRRLVVQASDSTRPLRFWVQNIDGTGPRAVTPEGVEGFLVTVNHSDYVSAREDEGIPRLYPIDGGEPLSINGLSKTEQIIGGAPQSDTVYVTSDAVAVPLRVSKVNIRTGLRYPFVTVSPADPVGVVFLFPPIFTSDEKRYVETQIRTLSVLYIASGLK